MHAFRALAVGSLLSLSVQAALFSNKNLRILPLGDSITHGTGNEAFGGYRGRLLDLLDGNYVDYVGPFSDSTLRDANHAGGPGYFIDDIKNWFTLVGWHLQPNVILLDGGTNDLNGGFGAPNVTEKADKLGNLLDLIHYLLPNTPVIVAQIGPMQDSAYDQRAAQFNTLVQQRIQTRLNYNNGYRLSSINIRGNLTTADLSDNVHPNANGYNKIADLWYNGINDIFNRNPSWISSTPANGVLVNNTLAVCPDSATILFHANSPITGLANAQNQFAGITCTATGNNQCSCVDPSSPNPNTASTYPVYRSCQEMSTTRTQAVQFADINGDGRSDYIYVTAAGAASYWLTTGQGATGSSLDNDAAGDITLSSQGKGIFGGTFTGTVRSQLRFADLDGDGRAELIIVSPSGSVDVWQSTIVYSTSNSQPAPNFNDKGVVFSGSVNGVSYPGAGLQFVDLDSDGLADMVYIGYQGDITAFRNLGPSANGFVSFDAPQVIYTNAPAFFGRDTIILQDMNGDGRADLILLNRANGAYSVYQSINPNTDAFNKNGKFVQFSSSARFSQSSPNTDGRNYQFADIGGTQRAHLIYVDPSTSGITTNTTDCVFLPAPNQRTA